MDYLAKNVPMPFQEAIRNAGKKWQSQLLEFHGLIADRLSDGGR
jgi:hypothetical protein